MKRKSLLTKRDLLDIIHFSSYNHINLFNTIIDRCHYIDQYVQQKLND